MSFENLKTIEIDGIQFQITLMPALKAAVLDRKVNVMLIPTLSGVMEKEDLDAEIDLNMLIQNLGDGLMKLSDAEYENLITSLLSSVTAVGNEGAMQLNTTDNINKIFGKKLITIYKLIFEVMKFNGFSVFGLVGDGLGIGKINSSNTLAKEIQKFGMKSEV